MRSKQLFFDLDHTLWDFDANARESLLELFQELELEKKGIPGFDTFYISYFKHNERLWERFRRGYITRKDLGFKRMWHVLLDFKIRDTDLAYAMNDKYLELLPQKDRLMPGAKETLDYLREKGYPLHIITNGHKTGQDQKMRAAGIDGYFDVVVTSEIAGRPKPHPDIFRYALEKTSCNPLDGWMIGDALQIDILGAANMEMSTIFFNPKKLTDAVNGVAPTFSISELVALKQIL